MRKKLLFLLLIVSLLCTGCGNSKKDNTKNSIEESTLEISSRDYEDYETYMDDYVGILYNPDYFSIVQSSSDNFPYIAVARFKDEKTYGPLSKSCMMGFISVDRTDYIKDGVDEMDALSGFANLIFDMDGKTYYSLDHATDKTASGYPELYAKMNDGSLIFICLYDVSGDMYTLGYCRIYDTEDPVQYSLYISYASSQFIGDFEQPGGTVENSTDEYFEEDETDETSESEFFEDEETIESDTEESTEES